MKEERFQKIRELMQSDRKAELLAGFTPEELLEAAERLQEEAEGHRQHARELRKLRVQRSGLREVK